MVTRYFEITQFRRGIPSKIVEYFGVEAENSFKNSLGKYGIIWKGQKLVFRPSKNEKSVNSVMAETATLLIAAKYMVQE